MLLAPYVREQQCAWCAKEKKVGVSIAETPVIVQNAGVQVGISQKNGARNAALNSNSMTLNAQGVA